MSMTRATAESGMPPMVRYPPKPEFEASREIASANMGLARSSVKMVLIIKEYAIGVESSVAVVRPGYANPSRPDMIPSPVRLTCINVSVEVDNNCSYFTNRLD
jgi:hypothetical protein